MSRKGMTLPCKICGEDYTDRISEDAIVVICARCAMRPDEAKEIEIDPRKLVDAIRGGKLPQFRKSLRITQDDLAERLGITGRHLRRMEDSSYIPNSKIIRKMELNLKNVRSV